MKNIKNKIIWGLVSILGAFAFSLIALQREESINAIWFITAAICIYTVAYRFYSAWIATKALVIDESIQTPAIRLLPAQDLLLDLHLQHNLVIYLAQFGFWLVRL